MKVIDPAVGLVAQSLIVAGGITVGADETRVHAALTAVSKATQPLEALPYSDLRALILSGHIPNEDVPRFVAALPETFRVWWSKMGNEK